MRTFWLRVALLVIATIVVHDVYMATTGHAVVAAGNTPATQDGDVHRHHEAPVGREHRQADPADAPGHCDPLRVAAPLNRDMSPSFDTVPTALLPDPAILMQFASTSRVIVEKPLPHPPDLNRALFQVYRI